MKSIAVKTIRFQYTKEEEAVKKTWGNDWKKVMKDYKNHGACFVLTAVWSGYHSAQSKVVHRQYVPWEFSTDLETIKFTDGTYLDIRVDIVPLSLLVSQDRKMTYKSLIREALESGKTTYEVTPKKEVANQKEDSK